MCFNLKLLNHYIFLTFFVIVDFCIVFHMRVFTIAHPTPTFVFLLILPFPAETQQVRVQYSSAPSKILNYRAKLRSRCLSKVSDQCTIAIQLYRRPLLLVEDAFPEVLLPESRSKTAMRDSCLSVANAADFELPALRQIPGQ